MGGRGIVSSNDMNDPPNAPPPKICFFNTGFQSRLWNRNFFSHLHMFIWIFSCLDIFYGRREEMVIPCVKFHAPMWDFIFGYDFSRTSHSEQNIRAFFLIKTQNSSNVLTIGDTLVPNTISPTRNAPHAKKNKNTKSHGNATNRFSTWIQDWLPGALAREISYRHVSFHVAMWDFTCFHVNTILNYVYSIKYFLTNQNDGRRPL